MAKEVNAKEIGARLRPSKGTETSSFGSPGRIGHNSAKFYSSKLYEGLNYGKNVDYVENEIPEEYLNVILPKSSENMNEIPDNSIHIMITSPPYNVTKDYDDDLSLEEYINFLKRVWKETYRVLVPGGRACINIANLGRKPYIPLHSYIIDTMHEIGFLMRGEIIWNKGSSASPSTAWGSWLSAANPVLRDVHEYILIFSKDTFSRNSKEKNGSIGHTKTKESTIKKEDFLEWTKSVWSFPAVSAKKIGHPAPFPKELPHRLIELYTFKDEVVLDPFAGSGTTCLSALRSERKYIGYELNPEYVSLAKKRIADFQKQLNLFVEEAKQFE